jgi:hypothetical protein
MVEWEPHGLLSRGPIGFDVDEEGNLYTLMANLWEGEVNHWIGRRGVPQLAVWGRDGRYARTLIPVRRDVPAGRLPGVKFQAQPTGEQVPDGLDRPSLLGFRCSMIVRNGTVTLFGRGQGAGGARLVRLSAADGGVPEGGCEGPRLPGRFATRFPGYMAASPDGRTFYVTGMAGADGRPANAVLRAEWTDVEARPFLDAASGLGDPRGLATDAAGRLYVCDHGNDRVRVFSPDGKPLKSLAVTGPEQVRVHPKTGAVYVLSVRDKKDPRRKDLKIDLGEASVSEYNRSIEEYRDKAVVKFGGIEEPRPAAEIVLPDRKRSLHDAGPILALDASGPRPALLISAAGAQEPGDHLWKIEDRGERLEAVAAPVGRRWWPFGEAFCAMAADRGRDEVYVAGPAFDRFYRLDGASGALAALEAVDRDIVRGRGRLEGPKVSGLAVDDSGRIYVRLMGTWSSYHNWIRRYERDGRRVPFGQVHRKSYEVKDGGLPLEAGGSGAGDEFVVTQPSRGYHSGTLAVAPDGRLYVLEKLKHGDANVINVYGPEGQLVQGGLVPRLSGGSWGPRLDAAGNLYLTETLVRKREAPPYFTGSLLKCGPRGARIEAGPDEGPYMTRLSDGKFVGARLDGFEWAYEGVDPCPWRHCVCSSAPFDVDGWGRSVVSNVRQHRLMVVDAAGNRVAAFGEYGNRDSAGPGSAVPVPEIPFWEPGALAVSDRAVYVHDRRNFRIVCVRLDCAAEASCPVR